jgi:hypothetical protein
MKARLTIGFILTLASGLASAAPENTLNGAPPSNKVRRCVHRVRARALRLVNGFLLSIAAATAAHAIPQDTDPSEPTDPKPSASFAVGPAYIFGTHNTKMTVLKLDPAGSRLCSPALSECRPAYGMEALFRSQQMQVTQLVKWDRSGVFGLNATEMIACFLYFDGPGGAYFSCRTGARPSTTSDSVLSQAVTSLAWSAYSGAGLQPQSASRQRALYDKRKSTTAYAKAYGTLPPDRMHALDTEEDPVPLVYSPDAPPPEVEFETVVITFTGATLPPPPPPLPTPSAPSIILAPTIFVTPPTQPRAPIIIVDQCVTFQICSEPPPPPPQQPPPVCTPQCNEVHTAMSAACTTGLVQLGTAAAIIVPVGALVATFVATPVAGATFFKVGGFVAGAGLGAWTGACKAVNDSSLQACIARAKQKGC